MSQHIVMSEQNGVSVLRTQEAPSYSPLDFPGWKGMAAEDSGIFMFIFDIDGDAAEYPLHASEDAWLAYVITGMGILFSGNPEGEKLGQLDYQAGDLITFQPNTQHAWKNGGAPSKILFTKQT